MSLRVAMNVDLYRPQGSGRTDGGQASFQRPNDTDWTDMRSVACCKYGHRRTRLSRYLRSRKPLSVKKVKLSGTLLTLIADQPKDDRIEVAAPTAGNAKRELEAIAVPTTTAKTITLFVGMLLDEHTALLNHQGVKN